MKINMGFLVGLVGVICFFAASFSTYASEKTTTSESSGTAAASAIGNINESFKHNESSSSSMVIIIDNGIDMVPVGDYSNADAAKAGALAFNLRLVPRSQLIDVFTVSSLKVPATCSVFLNGKSMGAASFCVPTRGLVLHD